jgi:hypothetical protein
MSDMRIKIFNPAELENLQKQFEGYKITGHIEVGIDGTWFVIDRIEPKEAY